MQDIRNHFAEHAPTYKHYLTALVRTLIGTVLVGLAMACMHFLAFLYRVSKLPKDSREYLHKRQFVEPQALVRYIITVLCIFTIDGLLLYWFEWVPFYFGLGLLFVLGYLGLDYLKKQRLNANKNSMKTKSE